MKSLGQIDNSCTGIANQDSNEKSCFSEEEVDGLNDSRSQSSEDGMEGDPSLNQYPNEMRTNETETHDYHQIQNIGVEHSPIEEWGRFDATFQENAPLFANDQLEKIVLQVNYLLKIPSHSHQIQQFVQHLRKCITQNKHPISLGYFLSKKGIVNQNQSLAQKKLRDIWMECIEQIRVQWDKTNLVLSALYIVSQKISLELSKTVSQKYDIQVENQHRSTSFQKVNQVEDDMIKYQNRSNQDSTGVLIQGFHEGSRDTSSAALNEMSSFGMQSTWFTNQNSKSENKNQPQFQEGQLQNKKLECVNDEKNNFLEICREEFEIIRIEIEVKNLMSHLLVGLNELEQSDLLCREMLLQYGSQMSKRMKYSYQFLLIECAYDYETLREAYSEFQENYNAEQNQKDKEAEDKYQIADWWKVEVAYCRSLMRMGKSETLRETLRTWRKRWEDLRVFLQTNLVEVWELLIYSNEMPIQLRMDSHLQDDKHKRRSEKNLLTWLLDECVQCLMSVSTDGYSKGSVGWKYFLEISKEYSQIAKDASEYYCLEQIEKLEKEYGKTERPVPIREEHFNNASVVPWLELLQISMEQSIILDIEGPTYPLDSFEDIRETIKILRITGAYASIVRIIDSYLSRSQLSIYQNDFPWINIDRLMETLSKYTEDPFINSSMPGGDKVEKYNGNFLDYSDIMYQKLLSLLYLKRYQEILPLLSHIIESIISRERTMSYSLLPFLHLLEEVAIYLSYRTLATKASDKIREILFLEL